MGSAKDADWSRTGTIVTYAEWLRKLSGALAVIVVRRDDAALAADPEIAPMDVKDLVCDRAERLADDLELARKEKRKAARVELGPCPE